MKLSFTTLATPQLSGAEAIRLARQYGFHGIDMRVSANKGELTLEASSSEIAYIKNTLMNEDIQLVSLMSYAAAGELDSASWHRMSDSIRSHLELADRVQAAYVRVGLGMRPEGLDKETWLGRIEETLLRSMEGGMPKSSILVQNHYNNFNAMEIAALVKRIHHPKLSMLLSTDHCLIQNDDIQSVLREAAGWTKQLYVADIIRRESGYDDVLPGTGEAPLPDFYKGLGGQAYDGWITMKWERVWRPYLESHEVIMPLFHEYINKHFK
jgi:sugar phosphate isomerase/epimerase